MCLCVLFRSMFDPKWDARFMEMAQLVAGWSKDPNTKVGAVIIGPGREIVSVGYNGIPRGVDDEPPERSSREGGEKYFWYEHAERNALYNALRVGRSVQGCTMFVTMFPCADCARAIIQSGITGLVCPKGDADRWSDSHDRSATMLRESGVSVVSYVLE